MTVLFDAAWHVLPTFVYIYASFIYHVCTMHSCHLLTIPYRERGALSILIESSAWSWLWYLVATIR